MLLTENEATILLSALSEAEAQLMAAQEKREDAEVEVHEIEKKIARLKRRIGQPHEL